MVGVVSFINAFKYTLSPVNFRINHPFLPVLGCLRHLQGLLLLQSIEKSMGINLIVMVEVLIEGATHHVFPAMLIKAVWNPEV
jgi:hypothetical protein